MSRKEIVRILKEFSDRQLLDAKITRLLLENYDEVDSYVREVQAATMEFYERQFAVHYSET